MSDTPLLDTIREPKDLRALPVEQLPQVCHELRQDLLNIVCETGGHLGSTLGVIELTVAMHYVFNSPHDKIVWDVGHQAYAHKMLTGRRDRMPTIRKDGGISGFLKRNESIYDAFGAGHAGTSISAALGMREAFHARGEKHKVVALIGDSSVATGMAFEAMNHAGALPRNLVVILNDNEMSIAPAVGALKTFLRARLSGQLYNALKRDVKAVLAMVPGGEAMTAVARRVDERVKSLVTPGVLFEGLGFDYIGPIDGHDVVKLVEALQLGRDVADRPVLIHAHTIKGKGYAHAESHYESMHGVVPFDLATGKNKPSAKPAAPTYTHVYGETAIQLAEADPRVVAITAGMPSGTGLTKFGERFPDRFYDVGISEQHAVTFAAGLACEGMRPLVTIYSTFLQRAFDQVVHDVAIQNLPVVFCMDRGGLAGADGATHHGWGDISWMRSIPNLTVMAPKDENEMRRMIKTGLELSGPSSVRYPRGEGEGVALDPVIEPLPVGKGEIVFGDPSTATYGVAAIGTMVGPAVKAAEALAKEGVSVCVVNARFAKPLDVELLSRLAACPGGLVTVEENALLGGFGSAVLEMCAERNQFPAQFVRMGLPDEFVHHGSPSKLKAELGLDATGIAAAVRRMVAVRPIRRANVERA
ncbi:MAG TPA: 1-deoxy-D-xylulose-5-phosphate synthase [bacterium]|nr:1-deoxy-D-xylulose-5-phosphate synthase [bacterium]